MQITQRRFGNYVQLNPVAVGPDKPGWRSRRTISQGLCRGGHDGLPGNQRDYGQAFGAAPDNNFEGIATVDVIQAKDILQQVSREVQSVGWHFNSEREYPLLPDVNGEIILASNMVFVDADTEPDIDVAQRGNKLYDRKNHTFKFQKSIKAEVVYLLGFEELPQVARQFIVIRAARIFQDRMVGSDTLLGFF
jgi:hypothetical protein